MPHHVADLAEFLTGTWRVDRTMTELAHDGAQGTFTGTVTFTPERDGTLRHHESGLMVWPTHSGPATRDYLLRSTEQPAVMIVEFTDGRPFHVMDLSTGQWNTEHGCAPDDYTVTYTVTSPDAYTMQWDVRGPRKNLRLLSQLRRITPDPAPQ